MKTRIAKVRITDNRPPGAGSRPALERATVTRGGGMTGLDALSSIQDREAAEHDKFVACYNAETVEAAWYDLNERVAFDRKNHEHRWVMNRRAALARRAQQLKGMGALV